MTWRFVPTEHAAAFHGRDRGKAESSPADYGMGVAAGDFNNDGCVDLYLTNFGRNQMFRNNCDGTFSDVSKASGTDNAGWSVSAAFVDFDRDGWLDLYVGNYLRYNLSSNTGVSARQARRTTARRAAISPSLVGFIETRGTARSSTSRLRAASPASTGQRSA